MDLIYAVIVVFALLVTPSAIWGWSGFGLTLMISAIPMLLCFIRAARKNHGTSGNIGYGFAFAVLFVGELLSAFVAFIYQLATG